MRPFKLCNCVIVSVKMGWEICFVVQWFVAGVAVRICCIVSRVCEVRARLMNIFGRVRVMSVVCGKTETQGLPLSRCEAVCSTG